MVLFDARKQCLLQRARLSCQEKRRAREKAAKIKRDEIYRYASQCLSMSRIVFLSQCRHLFVCPRLRTIKKEIADKERSVLEKVQMRLEAEARTPYKTQRLGKQQYPLTYLQ